MRSGALLPLSRGRSAAAGLVVAAACVGATDPGEAEEPEVWRSYSAVRLDTTPVPVLWGINGADTNRLISYGIELRVDGTTAYRSAFKVSTRPETLRTVITAAHAIVGDSLFIGEVRTGLSDTTFVLEERMGPGRYWLFRVRR